ASKEMSDGNKAILEEIKILQDATVLIRDSMNEMSIGAKGINQTGVNLTEISKKMEKSIEQISGEIDLFKV
ncbi:MAG: methyl-accepting chemotaxis protein, partial [Treponema sp.]